MQWFIVQAGNPIGPYTSKDIRSFAQEGRIRPDTTLRRESDGKEVPARKLKAYLRFSRGEDTGNQASGREEQASGCEEQVSGCEEQVSGCENIRNSWGSGVWAFRILMSCERWLQMVTLIR